jgi:hypothetical protein
MYFEVAETHPGAVEAAQARACLLVIAESYERAGKFRQARGIYERLF